MQTGNTAVIGTGTNILAMFDNIEVRNEDRIAKEDREFCENQQAALYVELDSLQEWYNLFYQHAQQHNENHRLKWATNGTVKENKLWNKSTGIPEDYKNFSFEPYESLNNVVWKYQNAINEFGKRVVRHFQEKYKLSVSSNDIDKENTPMGFRPVYQTYFDIISEHLNGRGFRETAEDELIAEIHNIFRSRHYVNPPLLKGDKITFSNVFNYDSWQWEWSKKIKINWDNLRKIDSICRGLNFFANNSLQGDRGMISGINWESVDVSGWYSLTTSSSIEVKLFKNGRIDVKFASKSIAAECYQKLRLNELE